MNKKKPRFLGAFLVREGGVEPLHILIKGKNPATLVVAGFSFISNGFWHFSQFNFLGQTFKILD